MDKNVYHKSIEASMISKFLEELSIICGESVVLEGIKSYVLLRDKKVVNLSSFTSD